MIRGRVTKREAIVHILVGGPADAAHRIAAVIDTGYNGHLTLPGHLIDTLSRPFVGHSRATLADGSTSILESYVASVIWHEVRRDVLISRATGTPLLGMALLEGSRLTIEAVYGGNVSIEEIA